MTTSLPPLVDFALRLCVAVAAAVLLAFLAPPANLHWLQWFAYIPMMLVIRPAPQRRSVGTWLKSGDTWIALIYGIVGEGAIFFWIAETIARFEDNIPMPAALGILALFSLVFGLPYIILWWLYPMIRRRFGVWWVLAFPALMVLLEFLGMFIILFPYNQGIGQYRVPSTFLLTSVTGVWGVTFLVLFVNACIAEIVLSWREGRGVQWAWLGAAAGLWGAVNLFGVWRYNTIEADLAQAPTLRVLQLQDNVDMLDRLRSPPCTTWEYWYGESAKVTPGSVDLIVWSEGGSVYPLNQPRKARNYRNASCKDVSNPADRLKELATRLDAEIVVGASAVEFTVKPDGKRGRLAFNSVYHFMPDGSVERYDKLVPLPFGEYIPFADWLPWLRELVQGPGNFRAGTEAIVFEGRKANYGTPICYEAILPHVCRRFQTADLLINGSLDTWFGDTAAPHQHAMLATARAYELGIPLFRNAYTGVSLVTEPHGRIYAETTPYKRVNRIVTVRLGSAWTLYKALAPFGLQDWFVWLCGIGLVGGGLAMPWVRRRRAGS